MPQTRRDLGRDAKVDEILDVARRQLGEGGFPALSMAGIARELGVAQNAVYWYFPSRDHVFVAVLRQIMADIAARKPPGAHDHVQRAVWFVDRIAEIHPLIVALHERSEASPVVADFKAEVEALVRSMIGHALEGHVPAEDMAVAVESYLATVEGALLRRLPRRQRAEVVRYTLERFTDRRPRRTR